MESNFNDMLDATRQVNESSNEAPAPKRKVKEGGRANPKELHSDKQPKGTKRLKAKNEGTFTEAGSSPKSEVHGSPNVKKLSKHPGGKMEKVGGKGVSEDAGDDKITVKGEPLPPFTKPDKIGPGYEDGKSPSSSDDSGHGDMDEDAGDDKITVKGEPLPKFSKPDRIGPGYEDGKSPSSHDGDMDEDAGDDKMTAKGEPLPPFTKPDRIGPGYEDGKSPGTDGAKGRKE